MNLILQTTLVTTGQRAADSPLFWIVTGVIGLVLLLLVTRNFFHWYFGISQLNARIEELADRLDRMGSDLPSRHQSGQTESKPVSAAPGSDLEVAIALASLKHLSKT